MIKCKKHPQYKAIRRPIVNCPTCKHMFKLAQRRKLRQAMKGIWEYRKFLQKKAKNRKEKGSMKATMHKLKSPKGKIYKTDNLAKFARKYRLSRTGLSKIVNGRQMTHKNWTVG